MLKYIAFLKGLQYITKKKKKNLSDSNISYSWLVSNHFKAWLSDKFMIFQGQKCDHTA